MDKIIKHIIPVVAISWCISVLTDSFLGNQFGLSFIYEDWASMTPLTAVLFIILFSTQFFTKPTHKIRIFWFLGVIAVIDLIFGLTFESRVIISSRATSLLFILVSVQGAIHSIERLQYLRITIKFFVYCVSNIVLILYFISPQTIYSLPWLETVSWNTAIGFLLYTSMILSAYYDALLVKQDLPEDFAFFNKKFISFWFFASFFAPVIIILGISLFYFFNVLDPQTGMAIALFSVCLLPFPITYFIYKEMIEWSNVVYKKNEQIFHRDKDIRFHNELLEEFAQITSHNLRGPAVGLKKLTEIAFDDEKPKKIRKESLELLKEKVPNLVDTIDDLSSFYNMIRMGKVEYDTCDIEKFINLSLTSCIDNFTIHAEEIKLQLDLEVEKVEYPTVYLENIFYNLISNSIKYRKKDEPLIIKVSTKSIKNDEVEIKYWDNGVGINLKYFKDKIFEFGKSYHNFKDSRGIGLFIVKNQISRLGDTIEVNSEEGVYTEFIINLNYLGKKELGYN